MASAGRWIAMGCCLLAALGAAAREYGGHPAMQAFVATMVARHGFERAALERLFDQARYQETIVAAMDRPAERVKPWYEYRAIFLTEKRIRDGVDFWRANQETLARAQRDYGVDPAIVVAIIGVETFYGRNMGSFRVLDALATLAFDYPKRSEFFARELEQYLLLTREQQLDPLDLKGSYAGAMGYGQFIPSSYRAYAVDYNGDRKADIWNDPTDAIGSVANYFNKHGWRKGDGVISRRSDARPKRLIRVLRHLHGSAAQVGYAGHRLHGLLDVEAGHRATATGGQVRPGGVEDGGDAVHARGGAGQAVGRRGELAGEQAEEAAAEQVDVEDRAPGGFVELFLLETQLIDRRQEHAPVDLHLTTQAIQPVEPSAHVREPDEPFGGAGLGHVRPATVVVVVAGIGGVDRVVPEEVGEEGVLRLGEAGSHGAHGATGPLPDTPASWRHAAWVRGGPMEPRRIGLVEGDGRDDGLHLIDHGLRGSLVVRDVDHGEGAVHVHDPDLGSDRCAHTVWGATREAPSILPPSQRNPRID